VIKVSLGAIKRDRGDNAVDTPLDQEPIRRREGLRARYSAGT